MTDRLTLEQQAEARELATVQRLAAEARARQQNIAPTAPPAPAVHSVADLLRRQIPPVRWAVAGLIPEGVSLLVGAPKVGKSWLALQAAIAVSTGARLWHDRPAEVQGDVLYLGLEDNDRRMQSRSAKLVEARADRDSRGFPQSGPALSRLHYATTWPRMDAGGVDLIEQWLAAHPGARLVVIDTLGRFRPPESRSASAYAADYRIGEMLKPLADRYAVAILLLHHTRKAVSPDVLDSVSGTAGLTGSVDALLILRRERGQMDAGLYVTGRDIENEEDHALTFDPPSCTWSSVGTVAEAQMSRERCEVLELLRDGGPMKPVAIAKALGRGNGAVRVMLHRMLRDGEVREVGGGYLPTLPPCNGGNGSNTSNASSGVTPGRTGATDVSPVTGVTRVTAPSKDAAAYRAARDGQ